MKTTLTLFLLGTTLLLTSCVEEKASEYVKVIENPLVGPNQELSIDQGESLTVSYSAEKSEGFIDPELIIVEGPENGKLENCLFSADKMEFNCTYIPNKEFFGTDSVVVSVKDGDISAKEPARIYIHVKEVVVEEEVVVVEEEEEVIEEEVVVASAPVAGKDITVNIQSHAGVEFSIPEGKSFQAGNKSLNYHIVKGPSFGKLSNCFGSANKTSCIYTANDNFTDKDTFSYVVIDAEGVESEVSAKVNFVNKIVVCEGFGEEDEQNSLESGLVGRLIDGGDKSFATIDSFLERGQDLNIDIFLSKLDFPTQPFSEGFKSQNGDLIKNDKGEVLYEYFSLEFSTILTLPEDMEPGYYEIATLSDDGARVRISEDMGESYSQLLSYSGVTATRLTCGKKLVYFDHNTQYPAIINYFQGPRLHIALMLMWRKVDSPSGNLNNYTSTEDICGVSSTTGFFNSNNNYQPSTLYNTLTSNGWDVIPADAFKLPSGKQNSCYRD